MRVLVLGAVPVDRRVKPGRGLGYSPVEPLDDAQDGEADQPGPGLVQAIENVVHHRHPDRSSSSSSRGRTSRA